ncbi:MAG: hypothetical protein NTU41_03645 [Chloroflexi bacterium]|nr:hypothetical protein [Chloroflexota bacterium]
MTRDKAQEIGQRFLLERYPRGKIEFSTAQMTDEGGVLAYCLEGRVEVRSGTIVSQFLWPADRYAFRMWVSASVGRIIRWELK